MTLIAYTYNYYFNLNQEFYLPKDFKIAIWAGRGSEFQHGPQTYHARSAVHISIDKAFFNKKLNITLALHDVFYKDYFSLTTKYSDQSGRKKVLIASISFINIFGFLSALVDDFYVVTFGIEKV